MTVNELKAYIYENHKIEDILQALDCHFIQYHSNREYYSAAFPDGDNPQGINIKNNKYLNFRSYSRNVTYDDNKDLIDLVERIKQCSFVSAVKYLHKILDIPYVKTKGAKKQKTNEEETRNKEKNRLSKFSKHQKINVEDVHTIPENVLDDYTPLLYIDWLREGIMPWTAKKYGLAFSYRRQRIIIPMRHWETGELLGINSRTVHKNYEELGIRKFLITSTYQKNLNLFGLYENKFSIEQLGQVVVFEAEKSVLKRDSLNDQSCVALSGHSMSDEQASILLGLNVDIVIAMDKDVPLQEVRYMCERFYGKRNIYYIYDKWDLLGEKDSPADARNKIYQFLLKYKIKYDAEEHREFLKQINNKVN